MSLKKSGSFIGSLLAGLMLFSVVILPLTGVMLSDGGAGGKYSGSAVSDGKWSSEGGKDSDTDNESGADSDTKRGGLSESGGSDPDKNVGAAVIREYMLCIDDGEKKAVFAVTADLSRRSAEVSEIADKGEKSFSECYDYGGASYLLSAVEREYPSNFDRYVILDKTACEKIIDFIGGAIVSGDNVYYNKNNDGQTVVSDDIRIVGGAFFDEMDAVGRAAAVKGAVNSFLNCRDTDGAVGLLFRLSDTDISMPSYTRVRKLFYEEE